MSDYIVGYSQRRGRVIFDRGSVCVEIEIDQTKKHRILAVLRKAMDAVAQAERVVDDMTDVEVHAYVCSHGSLSKMELPVSDTPNPDSVISEWDAHDKNPAADVARQLYRELAAANKRIVHALKSSIVPSRCRYCDAPIKRNASGNPLGCDPWGRMATYTCGSWDVTHGGMNPADRRSKQCVKEEKAKEAKP